MITILLVIWYVLLMCGFAYCTAVAFGCSLWSEAAGKRWAERAALILIVGIASICAVSYFK